MLNFGGVVYLNCDFLIMKNDHPTQPKHLPPKNKPFQLSQTKPPNITFDQIWFCAPKNPTNKTQSPTTLKECQVTKTPVAQRSKINVQGSSQTSPAASMAEVNAGPGSYVGLLLGPTKNQMKNEPWDFRVPCFCGITFLLNPKTQKNNTQKNDTLRWCFFEWSRYFSWNVDRPFAELTRGVVDHGIKRRFSPWDFFGLVFPWWVLLKTRGVHGICKTNI